jgi:hypothetical protein
MTLVFNLKGVCDGCKSYQPDKIPICKDRFGPTQFRPIWCPDYKRV